MLSDDSPFVTFAAKRWGKRPVFLFSSFSDIIGTVVCVTGTNSYSQFLAGRIIQGISASAYESICWACLGDMYFVHQRGLRVSIFYVIQCSLTVFIPIVSGTIATNLGWRWNINIFLIFCVVQFICAFLWLYETTYTRAAIYEIDTSGEKNVTDLVKAEQSTAEVEEVAGPTKGKSYLQQLKVYNGVYDDSNVLKPFGRLVVCCLNPATLYSILTASIIITYWTSCMYIFPQIYGAAPFNLDAQHIGYLYIGAFIAGLVSSTLMALFYDRLCIWIARKNGGVYEPEFRLWIMWGCLIATILGFFGIANAGWTVGYIAAAAWYGLIEISIVIAAIACAAYIVDGYRAHTVEIFIISASIKNVLYWSVSLYVSDWVLRDGVVKVYNIMGAFLTPIVLVSIPMYIWGKKV